MNLPGGSDLPPATVARLPVYLRELNLLSRTGVEVVSSGALAEAVGVGPAQLRKDLSHLGSYGTRGVGYDVAVLPGAARPRDGLRARVAGGHRRDRQPGSRRWPDYSGFSSRGFRIVALVDPNPDLIGREINGIAITDLADLEGVVARTKAVIAVLATPAEAAQAVADRLVYQGVTSILNFAAERAHRAGPRHRTEGGSRSGAPDPGLPRAAQGRRRLAAVGRRRSPRTAGGDS